MYQFARDAAVAEAWLIAQEPYLMSQELGHTIDEVEALIKKHEAFEKSAAAQEDRFSALTRLTTVRSQFWLLSPYYSRIIITVVLKSYYYDLNEITPFLHLFGVSGFSALVFV